MEKRKNNSKTLLLLSVLLMVIIAVTVIVGLVSAKYVTEHRLPGKITIQADLAKSIDIFEHPLTSSAPDEYELDMDADPVYSNKYMLMPGVDVPKDPTVYIEEYTGVNAYVYVEVINNIPQDQKQHVTFNLAEEWTLLSGVTGPSGGAVYYYTGELQPAEGESFPTDITIAVLDGTGLTVSDQLKRTLKNVSIDFNAFIAQRTSAEASASDAASVFAASFLPASGTGSGN